mgnify:CR=1 FL=1
MAATRRTQQRIRLLRSFHPATGDDQDVPDPILGGPDAYLRTLDLVEAVLALEEEWNIDIPEEEMEGVKTVGQAVALVEHKLGAS